VERGVSACPGKQQNALCVKEIIVEQAAVDDVVIGLFADAGFLNYFFVTERPNKRFMGHT
jgi:hypothetical protein